MLNVAAYVGGILAHVIFKWSDWTKDQPDPVIWHEYWRDHLAENIGSGVAALVCIGVWTSGLGHILGIPNLAGDGPMTPGVLLFLGFATDSVARHVVKRFAG